MLYLKRGRALAREMTWLGSRGPASCSARNCGNKDHHAGDSRQYHTRTPATSAVLLTPPPERRTRSAVSPKLRLQVTPIYGAISRRIP